MTIKKKPTWCTLTFKFFRLGIDIENLSDLDSEEESDSSNSEKSSEDQSVSSSSCQEQTEATSIDPSQNIASKSQVTPDSEVNMEETQQTSSDSCKDSKQESTVGQTDIGGQSSSSSSSTVEPDKGSTETQVSRCNWCIDKSSDLSLWKYFALFHYLPANFM